MIGHLRNRWREAGGSLPSRPPRSIYEFDDRITAPLSGFQDAEDYYAQSSSGPRLRDITLPTRILAAQDDPLVSFEAIESAQRSNDVSLFVTETGGHLGFFFHNVETPQIVDGWIVRSLIGSSIGKAERSRAWFDLLLCVSTLNGGHALIDSLVNGIFNESNMSIGKTKIGPAGMIASKCPILSLSHDTGTRLSIELVSR